MSLHVLAFAVLAMLTTVPNGQAQTQALQSYRITLGRVQLPGMPNDPASWCAAGIRCSTGTGAKGLDICFISAGLPLPPNTAPSGSYPLFVMYRPITEFPYYVDLLRNEKPLHMALDPQRPERINISNMESEPVGEGEQ
jgi:hypothetical protein